MFKQFLLQCLIFDMVCSISRHPILIIVSYDAFGSNYFDTDLVPNMLKIKKAGTSSDYLINMFPTKTFPNHYTIATGLYPEVHGVIGNWYFDEKKKEFVQINYDMFHYNEDIVPIWRLNEDQAKDRHSGTMMWPGADYAYQGKNITYSKSFSMGYNYFKRVDEVLSWITDSKKPANLVMLYIEEPDSHGHVFGTNSERVKELIRTLDNVTKYLEDQLEKFKLTDKVNVIHVSDHGMINVKPPHFINITQYLPYGTYYYGGASPCLQIIPKEGFEEHIYEALKNASSVNGHFKVYRKKDYLPRWHYKNNPRSPPILVMADVGYALDDLILAAPKYAAQFNFTLTNDSEFGVHGYDYIVPEMHPIFMARGPKVKKEHKVAPFHTTDLYNLFAEILDIPAKPNNGSLGNIIDILVKSSSSSVGNMIVVAVGAVMTTLFVISVIAAIVLFLIKRQQNIRTAAALNKRFPQTFQNNIIEAQHLLEPEDA